MTSLYVNSTVNVGSRYVTPRAILKSWTPSSRCDGSGSPSRPRLTARRSYSGKRFAVEGHLAALLERRGQARTIKAANGTTHVAELVFHRAGRPIVDFRKAWRAACLKAGVPGRLLRDSRRTAARNLVRAGVSEHVAMSITGHRTCSMFDRYNVTSEADLRDAALKAQAYADAQPVARNVVVLPKRAEAVQA